MSRKSFLATTVAVVCGVGMSAGTVFGNSDGSGRVAALPVVRSIPDPVAAFLSSPTSGGWHPVHLSQPLDLELPVSLPYRASRGRHSAIMIDPPAPTSAELPLVPLPPPLWTGAAGLGGLALVALCRKARKALR